MTTVFSGDTGADTVGPSTVGNSQLMDGSISLAKLAFTPPFTKYYNGSGELALGTNFAYTLPHGFGVAPTLFRTSLICKVAEGGYAIGDVVEVQPFCDLTDTTSFTRGMSLVSDATNIYVRMVANAAIWTLVNKGTGALFATTSANWRLIVRAWA